MPKSRGKSVPIDRDEALGAARRTLESARFLRRSSIRPPALREDVVKALEAEGYEVTSTYVRAPLGTQLEAVLRERLHLPLRGIATQVAGATAKEAQAAALALVEAGKARRVLRTDADTIVSTSVSVVSGAKLTDVAKRMAALVERLRRVSRKGSNVGILRADLDDALVEMLPVEGAMKAVASTEISTDLTRILRAIDAVRDEQIGLSFIPKVSEILAGELDAATVKRALLAAESRGLVELRPEGGLGRLSEREAQACPEGVHGTRLSWARRRDQVLS